jgi:hypothetical protein
MCELYYEWNLPFHKRRNPNRIFGWWYPIRIVYVSHSIPVLSITFHLCPSVMAHSSLWHPIVPHIKWFLSYPSHLYPLVLRDSPYPHARACLPMLHSYRSLASAGVGRTTGFRFVWEWGIPINCHFHGKGDASPADWRCSHVLPMFGQTLIWLWEVGTDWWSTNSKK